MEQDEAVSIVNAAMQVQIGRQMSDIETLILEGAWQGQTYPQIADAAGYSVNYLTTDAGPKFWRALSQVLGEPVNKKNFKAALRRNVPPATPSQPPESSPANTNSDPTPHSSPLTPHSSTSSPTISWGEAPDVSQFYGRDAEQDILYRWIESESCRLIAILGMGGIGKSTLATRVVQQLADHAEQSAACTFTHVVWRSLRNAPDLPTLLTDLIGILSDQQETTANLPRLLHWLRDRRCLIVLDNVETILQAGEHAGYYRDGYEDYGELFRLLGETAHQSCVVFTSREKPAEIAALEGIDGYTRTLQLSGSVATALALINAKGLNGTTEQQRELCDRYSYNPLALKIVSTTIQDLFAGDISAFLAEDAVIFNSIRRLLDEQFQRLSDLEQSIMIWLAINRDWTEISELVQDIVPTVPKVRLLEALESLKWRGLIENRGHSYTQQPVVMEYVIEQLVERAITELTTAELDWLHCYALIKTTGRDYVTQSQTRLILAPVAHAVQNRFTASTLKQQLLRSLTAIRQSGTASAGYGAGNLINLCNCLKLDLTDYDFSQLAIRQADLRRRVLQRVNFTAAHFQQSVFTQTFGSIFSVKFSPDGQVLITGDNAGKIRLWSSVELSPLRTIDAHKSYIWDVAPSPDARYVASCSEDQTVKLWELTTGELKASLNLGYSVQAITWIQSDLLTVGSIENTIWLWNPFADAPPRTLQGHQDSINSLSWQPKGQILASSSNDQSIKLWDITTGKCLQTLTHHQAPVRWIAWSPDGQQLASGSEDHTIALWDMEELKRDRNLPVQILKGHRNAVWSLDWSPDGRYLASSSHDATIRLWDMQTGTCLRVLQGHQNWVWYARWHPTLPVMVSGAHDGTLKLWNVDTGQCLKTLSGHVSNARAFSLAPNGQELAMGCDDMILRFWRPQQPNQFSHFIGHVHLIADTSWSPDGRYVASASHDRTIRVWQRDSGQCLKVLRGHENWVWSVDWHPTDDLLASGSVDGTIKLWHPSSDQLLRTLSDHALWVLRVRWSPASDWLASCAADNTIRLWDTATWHCRHVLPDHKHWLWCIAWSSDGRWLASGSYDHTAKLWQVESNRVVCTHTLAHSSVVSAIAWHPQGDVLATGSHDSLIRLWQPQTGKCLAELSGHRNQISSLAFSADGTQLYSSSEDETLRIWDMDTLSCLANVMIDRPYEGMNITNATGLSAAQVDGLKALGAIADSRKL